MKKRNKAKKNLYKETEDWCFLCKDGGDLIVCDHKGCPKVYHATCVGKDETLLDGETHWACDRHTCFVCCKSTKIYCLCCPNAVCGHCSSAAEFTQLKGNGGLCDECVKMILLIEENADYDSDGEKLEFDNRDAQECLFKEYWEIIKEKEDLTLEVVYSADARIKKGKNHDRKCDSIESFGDEETDESTFESDKDVKVKRSRGKQACESVLRRDEIDELLELTSESDEGEVKRPRGSGKWPNNKSQDFEGWGSRPLICFLNSIGEDTTIELSRFDVDTIISKYIQEKGLHCPGKKRTVCCDDKLYSIFRKRRFNKNKMYHLLEPHFKDLVVLSDDDEKVDDHRTVARIRGMGAIKACKKQRTSDLDRKFQQKEMVQEVQKSCFAAISVDNLRLVYLRRSFVEELFKQPHEAEDMIFGSFVKAKVDSPYPLLKSSHQLLQVTGLKQESTTTNNKEILLLLSNLPKPVNIKMLSDSDISEEECEDLKQRMKDENSEKLTVDELQQKAGSLHEFITKLSMEKEIVLLQHLIDRANEKGWRKEKEMYLDKKALLNAPSEQERRLKQVPKVIAEDAALDPTSSSPYSEEDLESDE
ncbi:hypothetical protein SAY86_023705 [Trapa natans]|uniref:Uncharacterized protein n=1 Tax=Trapa natans TaxID=22666 RepID=A0AAN7MB54_TRANT|nr:hypothetical protein SAY86_023705 [Trapa natans]